MRAIKYLELKLIFQMDKQTLFNLMLVEHFRNESLHYVGANYDICQKFHVLCRLRCFLCLFKLCVYDVTRVVHTSYLSILVHSHII